MLNDKYTFIPWLKKGLGLYTSIEDNFEYSANSKGRPKLDAKLTVNGNIDVQKELELVGPGDVIGFESSGIMKTWPIEGTPDFQPNHLCFIEFFEEDLPWRYTPAIAVEESGKRHKLRPWIALVVLEENEFSFSIPEGNHFPVLQVAENVITQAFPSQKDLWAWAHVHVNGQFDNVEELKNLADGEGSEVYARLMCPRKLKANTNYHAFLIPSFEAGRLIGLGDEPYNASGPDVLAPAWNLENVGAASVSFPVYHSWQFTTTENDDFESVIDRLEPQPVPQEVGNLKFDVSQMGAGINASQIETQILGMPGPLKVPEGQLLDWNPPANGLDDADNFKKQLMAWMNQADILRQNGTFTSEGGLKNIFEDPSDPNYDPTLVPDPVISPPIYGRHQALVSKIRYLSTIDPSSHVNSGVVENPNWISDLNLEPRNRVAASIGASIIRENQEELMDAAWEQVGDIMEANQRIIQAELAKNVNYEAYRKFVFETDDGKLVELSGPMVKKLLKGDATIWKQITGSTLPNASLSGQFRSKKKARGKKSNLLNSKLKSQTDSVSFQGSLVKNLADDTNKPLVNAALPKVAPQNLASKNVLVDISSKVAEIENKYATDNTYSNAAYPKPPEKSGGGLLSGNVFLQADTYLDVSIKDAPLESIEVSNTKSDLVEVMNPTVNQANRLNSMLGSIGGSFKIVDDSYRFKPVLATPEFEFPVYEILKEKSVELFMPNLDLVPNNTISILESNYEFIEALLAGMSNEMGRELLWRAFPTDQRGTNFKYFWERFNHETLELVADISSIHTWLSDTKLGSSSHRPQDSDDPAVGVVLMLRGDVLKRYPNTMLFAQKADYKAFPDRRPLPYDNLEEDSPNRKYPIFEAKIDPDITFFGFDISVDEALGDADGKGGWFFVLQERPGDMAFGFDKADGQGGDKIKWEGVDWDDMLTSGVGVLTPHEGLNPTDDTAWGQNSADMAYAMFQKPVRVAIHASKMIETN